jgi:hypothetical protein
MLTSLLRPRPGKGSSLRTRNVLLEGVEQHKKALFRGAATEVGDALHAILARLDSELKQMAMRACEEIEDSYSTLFESDDMSQLNLTTVKLRELLHLKMVCSALRRAIFLRRSSAMRLSRLPRRWNYSSFRRVRTLLLLLSLAVTSR